MLVFELVCKEWLGKHISKINGENVNSKLVEVKVKPNHYIFVLENGKLFMVTLLSNVEVSDGNIKR